MNRLTEGGILDRDDQSPSRAETGDVPVRTYHASRRMRWRGLLMVAVALGAGAYLVRSDPQLDLVYVVDVVLLVVTWATLFWIAALGIERFFEDQPTLIARPEGLVLFPKTDPDGIVAWQDIRAIEVFTFGRGPFTSRFFTLVVDDPQVVSRHLPPVLRLAYRIDRWAAGDNRYFRPRSDFDIPVSRVVDELEAYRRHRLGLPPVDDGSPDAPED